MSKKSYKAFGFTFSTPSKAASYRKLVRRMEDSDLLAETRIELGAAFIREHGVSSEIDMWSESEEGMMS